MLFYFSQKSASALGFLTGFARGGRFFYEDALFGRAADFSGLWRPHVRRRPYGRAGMTASLQDALDNPGVGFLTLDN